MSGRNRSLENAGTLLVGISRSGVCLCRYKSRIESLADGVSGAVSMGREFMSNGHFIVYLFNII